MATEKQISANRENAKHCTGPRTPEGKAHSSQNALKTGIDAETLIIRTEDPAGFGDLTARYFTQFAPATEEERALVDALITSEWMRLRYLRAEAAVWNSNLDAQSSFSTAYSWSGERLARLDRRLNSALRSYTHALKQLQAIQSKKPTQFESATEPDPETASPRTSSTVSEADPEPADMPSNPKLVSFLTLKNLVRNTPSSVSDDAPFDPDPDDYDPPIAA